MYHTTQGSYVHEMGIKAGGKMAILAGAGPMGLGAIDYAINNPDINPSLLVVTDVDDARLARAASIITVEDAKNRGITLIYLNTKDINAVEKLIEISGGHGFDDVLVMAPVRPVVEQGDAILAKDGCMNFFAGPSNKEFKAEFNFYNVHYSATHIVGTSGGNNNDMRESLELMSKGRLNPAGMVTHVGGLDSVVDTTLNLPKIPGGKKLIYPGISLELTAIDDFAEKGKTDPLFAELSKIVKKTNNLWNGEAERYLLKHAKPIE
jgi:threonine dehydrogenase-like Zn-dependent dehydrogenase